MSVHLVGGGRDLSVAPVVFGGFVEEAACRARAAGRTVPEIAVCVVGPAGEQPDAVAWFEQALGGPVVRIQAVTAEEGDPLVTAEGAAPTAAWFRSLDGLLVGGGLTPAYHRALQPYGQQIRAAVAAGLPYAGFSAGASIAATRALVGGWRLGSIAVTHEDNAEDLDQLTVVDGLGLVGATIEVHTAQWGTLSRLVAAAAVGSCPRGIAVDENTVAIMSATSDASTPTSVRGAGQAWLVEAKSGVGQVRRLPAR